MSDARQPVRRGDRYRSTPRGVIYTVTATWTGPGNYPYVTLISDQGSVRRALKDDLLQDWTKVEADE